MMLYLIVASVLSSHYQASIWFKKSEKFILRYKNCSSLYWYFAINVNLLFFFFFVNLCY